MLELIIEESCIDALLSNDEIYKKVEQYISSGDSKLLKNIYEDLKVYIYKNMSLFEAFNTNYDWDTFPGIDYSRKIKTGVSNAARKVSNGVKKAWKYVKNNYYKARKAVSTGAVAYHKWRYKANKKAKNKLNNKISKYDPDASHLNMTDNYFSGMKQDRDIRSSSMKNHLNKMKQSIRNKNNYASKIV